MTKVRISEEALKIFMIGDRFSFDAIKKSGAEDTRTPDASRQFSFAVTREASGVRRVYRRFARTH
jgi:hypothetical protein